MAKEKKIGVSKIVINIGDKEAALTVEQARELRDALNAVLGEKVVEKIVERDHWYPYYPYLYGTIYGSDVTTTGTTTGGITGTTITYGNSGDYTITLDGNLSV